MPGPIRRVASDVSAGYGDRLALGERESRGRGGLLLAVVGPNGAGKSTLLKLMGGLLRPWHGRVEVLGLRPDSRPGRVAYVPQAELVDWGFPVTVNDGDDGPLSGTGAVPAARNEDRRAVAAGDGQVGMADHVHAKSGRSRAGSGAAFLARAPPAGPVPPRRTA